MTDDDGGLGWEDAYRSPASREPAAPAPPVRQPRAEEPAPPAAPAWGTPDSAPAKQGPVPVVPPRPAAGPAPSVPAAGTGVFRMLVEQTGGSGDSMRWKLEPEPTHAFGDRASARAAALDLCRRFAPQHPFSEQRRRIYRITDDEYLVTVQGMTSMFHFRVSVAEEI